MTEVNGPHSNNELILELIRKCRAGDQKAVGTLFETYSPVVRISISAYLKTYPAVPVSIQVDIFQIVWSKLLEDNCRRLFRFSGLAKFETWLSAVVINQTIDYLRRHKNEFKEVSLERKKSDNDDEQKTHEFPDNSPVVFDELIKEELHDNLRSILSGLDPYEKMLLNLKFRENLTQEQISHVVDRKLGTVGSDLSRLYSKLRNQLHRLGFDEIE